MSATDVYRINAILSAVASVKVDVDATAADILVACTEVIRQTVMDMPSDVRAKIVTDVYGALLRDDASHLERVWGARTVVSS